MHKSATKCNETLDKWCKNKHRASKIIDTLETYQLLSIIPCALVNVMLLVPILIIDTSLYKPVVLFTEFSFYLGTSEV
jgi:hypothetical protein